ncbi:MAG: hypothetical protein ACRDGF_10480, partial [Chloroflexota bacterium]
VDALQSATLVVGENSSDNQLLEGFDVAVSNTGTALAASGTSQAVGLAGDEAVGGSAGASGAGAAAVMDHSTTIDIAQGRSGDTAAVGLVAASSIQVAQGVTLTLNPSASAPLSIQDGERVVNVGLANAMTGSVNVTALRIPVAAPTTPAADPPGAPPSPASGSLAELPLPLSLSSPRPVATPVASPATPSATPVPSTPGPAPRLAQAARAIRPAVSAGRSAPLSTAGRPISSAATPRRRLLSPGGSLVLHQDVVRPSGQGDAYKAPASNMGFGGEMPSPAGVLAVGLLPLALYFVRGLGRRQP